MVTVQKFQTGVSNFIESEITSHLSGWKKLIAETTVGLYISQLPGQLESLLQTPAFSGLGIIKDGQIDVDLLANEMKKHFREPISIDIPALGKIELTPSDLDTLHRMIINA